MNLPTVDIGWEKYRRIKTLKQILKSANIEDNPNNRGEIIGISSGKLEQIYQIISKWLLVNKDSGETKKRLSAWENNFQKQAAANFVQTLAHLPNMTWATFLLTLRKFFDSWLQITPPVSDYLLEWLKMSDRVRKIMDHPLHNTISALGKSFLSKESLNKQWNLSGWMVRKNMFLMQHPREVFPGNYRIGEEKFTPLASLPVGFNFFSSSIHHRDNWFLPFEKDCLALPSCAWAHTLAFLKTSEFTARFLWIMPCGDEKFGDALANFMIKVWTEVAIKS